MIWLALFAGGWLAATISGVAGFGGGLLLLPLLTAIFGAKASVPVLTIAQLGANISRAGFSFKAIQWKPALLFCMGAVPFCVLGARLFVALPSATIVRILGCFLLLAVAFRRSKKRRIALEERWLPVFGGGVGFLSAVAGSAGPLGAFVFLSLSLPKLAYIATEAVTATLMHLTKTLVYGRFALLSPSSWAIGVSLGISMTLGSWTGKRLLERLPDEKFIAVAEGVMALSGVAMLIGF